VGTRQQGRALRGKDVLVCGRGVQVAHDSQCVKTEDDSDEDQIVLVVTEVVG